MKRFSGQAACLFILAAVPFLMADDSVDYEDEGRKQTARGTITAETVKEITITTSTGEKKIPLANVTNIRYDQQMPKISAAENALAAGQYEQAAEAFKALFQEAPADKPFLLGHIIFSAVYSQGMAALTNEAAAPEAIKGLEKYLARYPDSRHDIQVTELLGKLYLETKEFDKAAATFDRLKKIDVPGTKDRATVLQGIAALKQDKFPEAIQFFDEVIKEKGESAESEMARLSALVYKGDAMARSGQAAEAEKLLRATIDQIPAEEQDIKAVAHNALGDAMKANNKPPKEVLLDGYLWVPVVYNRNAEQTARALFQLAPLFDEIGQKDRGEAMRGRLRTEFPNSTWAKKLGTAS